MNLEILQEKATQNTSFQQYFLQLYCVYLDIFIYLVSFIIQTKSVLQLLGKQANTLKPQ